MCGLRTRPRTDVDPPRVELPSAGAYRLASDSFSRFLALYKFVCVYVCIGSKRIYLLCTTSAQQLFRVILPNGRIVAPHPFL